MGTLFVVVLFICAFIFAYKYYADKPSFNNAKKINIYIDGRKDEEYEHILKNNQIYISSDYLMKNELLDFYWDDKYHKISVFNDFNLDVLHYNQKKAFQSKKPYERDEVFIIEEDKLYFNANFIKENYIKNLYLDKNNLKVIVEENANLYKATKKTKLKSKASNQSDTLKDFETGESLFVYDYENDGWMLARTEDSTIGFIKLADIKPVSKIKYSKFTASNKKKQINMAWDLVYKASINFKPFSIPKTIDIVGPTWYKLDDSKKYFKDFSNDSYIKYIKSSQRDIWGVFSNSFDPDLTSKMLNDGIKRSEIADSIIRITEEKNYDAINIDFENIYMKDKDVFSAFIKELYCKAKQRNIMISVDITILSDSENWSLCYDRKVIGKYSDYIILMAYDENVSGLPGSVASLSWVEYGVKNILEYANSEKIILAVPFYTRLWEKGSAENNKVKSTALRIQSAIKAIEELKMELSYDKATGQNYGETIKDGITYMIWNEDETSLKNRMEISRKYNLAGCAVWALGYGIDDMWNLIN